MIGSTLEYLDSAPVLHSPSYVIAFGMLIAACAAWLAHRYVAHGARFSLKQLANEFFPFAGWRSRSSFIDIVVYAISRVVFRALLLAADGLILILAAALLFLAAQVGWHSAELEPGLVGVVICGLVLAMAYDLGDFTTHYLMHRWPLLWEVHKVHHSATFLSPITAFRAHPLEPYLYHVFHSLTVAPVATAIVLIYDVSLVDILLLMWSANLLLNFVVLHPLQHTHVPVSFGPLERVFVSPHMHQLHHSANREHWDRNIANIFSLWDWMAGTAVRQDPSIPVEYGLGLGRAADAEYLTLYGIYLRPIVNMARMVAGKRGMESARTGNNGLDRPTPTADGEATYPALGR